MSARSHLRIERNVLAGDDDRDDGGNKCQNADFAPHEPSLFNVSGGQGERGQRIQVPIREEEPGTEEDPEKMSVGEVGSPRPGGDGNDGENRSVYLWDLASIRGDHVLVAHIGHRNREVKPFRVGECVPTTRVPVFFTPVFTPGCGTGRRRLVENESSRAETNESEN